MLIVRPRGRGHGLALAFVSAPLALVSLCCNLISGVDDYAIGQGGGAVGSARGSSAPSSTAGTGGAGGGGGDAGQDAPGDADADVTPCTPKVESFQVVNDTMIVSGAGQCGTIAFGVKNCLNLAIGRGLLRFKLSPGAFQALATGTATSLTITLGWAPTCEGAASPGSDGVLSAYPLRNDWVEGTGGLVGGLADGATWCWLAPGVNWGANGANGTQDHGALAGTQLAPGMGPTVTFALDPAAWEPFWLDQTNQRMSVLLIRESGVFVMATREHTTAPRASIEVAYCDPGD
jgi:hypothetical protein